MLRHSAKYNGPQYSGQELSKKYRLPVPYKWRIELSNSQLSYLFLQHFGLDKGSTLQNG